MDWVKWHDAYDTSFDRQARLRFVQSRIDAAGLGGVISYNATDATRFSAYASMAPADLVLLAGVFGNLHPNEVLRLIHGLPCLCRRGAFVIWTRHCVLNEGQAAVRSISDLFRSTGFDAVAMDRTSDTGYVIGTHRFLAAPSPISGSTWFRFGDE